jgi:hypothetical protein
MARWKPIRRREFIGKLRRLGFEAPEPGGRHFFMRYGSYTLTLPSNKEYSVDQIKTLLREVQSGTKKKVSVEEWEAL